MPENNIKILEVEDLHVSYDGKSVIEALSFGVYRGDVIAVIGPNGSGKTTLLKAILGLMPRRKGRISLSGEAAKDGKFFSYIPQRIEIDRSFPISLSEMLALQGRLSDKYADMLELRGLLSQKVGELSGGELQRALLAYAVIKEPSLLLMDEPTSWVDVKGADCILCIMEEFKKKGIAMMIVSHDFSAVRSVATKVLGIGHNGHFFEEIDSPSLDEKTASLFETMHHCPPSGNAGAGAKTLKIGNPNG